jgi:hypothetical protein
VRHLRDRTGRVGPLWDSPGHGSVRIRPGVDPRAKDDSQIDALTAAGCERIWVDKASGKLTRRPEWDKCFEHLRRGDQLVITRLSRPFRSGRHMTELAAQLDERGIDLIVLKQGIDTTTPAGRFLFHVIAAMDEMTADLISEGTLEGLSTATSNATTTHTVATTAPHRAPIPSHPLVRGLSSQDPELRCSLRESGTPNRPWGHPQRLVRWRRHSPEQTGLLTYSHILRKLVPGATSPGKRSSRPVHWRFDTTTPAPLGETPSGESVPAPGSVAKPYAGKSRSGH